MQAIRTATHPKGFQIHFDPEPHHYHVDGERLMSVTTVIQKWFPQFDAEAVAKKKAAREGGSYEAFMAEWSRKRDEAAGFGTKAHLMAELILQEKDERAADHLAESEREKTYLLAIKQSLARIALGYEIIESEKIVFSPHYKIAGTIDLLMRSKATGEYVVGDWKTNREIKYAAFRQEKGHGPCSRLANCNFSHYSLQTSAYAELLTSEGYLPSGKAVRGVLLHLHEKSDGRVGCDYIKTSDLAAEFRSILRT